MNVRTWALALLVASACGPTKHTAPPSAGPAPGISWLAGAWEDDHGTREVWTVAKDGVMFGVNRSPDDSAIELLKIDARDGALVYTAVPPGQATTEFRAAAPHGDRIAFENPEHDFPTAITYERLGEDRMSATISGRASDRRITWEFHRRDAGEAVLRAQAGTVSREGETLTVELPGGFCARLVCGVLPDGTLLVAVLDTSNDCTAPAVGQCPGADYTATGEQTIEFLYSLDG